VLLRFFENKTLAEVGAALGVSEDGARVRVSRALDKLRKLFTQRGVDSTADAITKSIAAHSIQIAPTGLALAAAAAVKGTAVGGSTLTIVKGVLKIMAWTKAKTAIVVGTGIFLAAGTTIVAVKEIQEYRSHPIEIHPIEISQNLEFFSDPSSVTFESFLRNPPVIEETEYEIINPPPPPEAIARLKLQNPDATVGLIQTNFCSLRLDGANYILKESPINEFHGRFADTKWRLTQNNILVLADTKINSSQRIEPAVGFAPYVIKRFLNLGFDRIVPGTIDWPEGTDHFTAKVENSFAGENNAEIGTIDAQLHYKNGVPQTATVVDSLGRKYEIQYKYDPAFFSGKLPVEIDDMGTDQNGNSTKIGTVLIEKLQLTNSPIAAAEFDPMIVFKGKHRGYIYLSNDVSYGVTERGHTYRVSSLDQTP
jgi:hypothetical protein